MTTCRSWQSSSANSLGGRVFGPGSRLRFCVEGMGFGLMNASRVPAEKAALETAADRQDLPENRYRHFAGRLRAERETDRTVYSHQAGLRWHVALYCQAVEEREIPIPRTKHANVGRVGLEGVPQTLFVALDEVIHDHDETVPAQRNLGRELTEVCGDSCRSWKSIRRQERTARIDDPDGETEGPCLSRQGIGVQPRAEDHQLWCGRVDLEEHLYVANALDTGLGHRPAQATLGARQRLVLKRIAAQPAYVMTIVAHEQPSRCTSERGDQHRMIAALEYVQPRAAHGVIGEPFDEDIDSAAAAHAEAP